MWVPVANLEVAGFTERSTSLVVQASNAPSIRHLDGTDAAKLENSLCLIQGEPGIATIKMLEHAVRENTGESFRGKGKEPGISDHKARRETQLTSSVTGCQYSVK